MEATAWLAVIWQRSLWVTAIVLADKLELFLTTTWYCFVACHGISERSKPRGNGLACWFSNLLNACGKMCIHGPEFQPKL